MCGILGIGGPRGRDIVERLLPGLRHRGPDGSGIWSCPEWAFGHRRLAIIGLDDGGAQPFVSPSGRSVITFNGEIYNYLELADRLEAMGLEVDRRYDTAVLVTALEALGIDVLPELNGMFAFAWYRPAERRLLLARDRWGKKPLFWGRVRLDDGTRAPVFSSELRQFTELPGGPPPWSPLGVARYLLYDGMPDRETVYAGVEKLPAGSWLELDSGGRQLGSGQYWEFVPHPQPVRTEEAIDRCATQFRKALALRLRSDVPVGLFLSGGLDSSLVAAAWRKLRPSDPIHTFTIGFDEPSYDERESAQVMAEAIGADHHVLVISDRRLEEELDFVWNNLSEPFADPSLVPMSLLCRHAREFVTVAIGGDGADELQAGYDPFRAWYPSRVLERALPRPVWAAFGTGLERILPPSPANMSLRFKVRHFTQGLRCDRRERIQAWLASFPLAEALRVMNADLVRELDPEAVLEPTRRAFDATLACGETPAQVATWVKTYLECSILTKVDRASMMHSLEVRSPFLDMHLARTLADLPSELIFRHGRGKVLLRMLAADMVPSSLLRKKKKGFGVPQASWLRTVLRDRMEAALAETRRGGGWFRHDAIAAMWREHDAGRADYRRSLWNFLFSFPFQSASRKPGL